MKHRLYTYFWVGLLAVVASGLFACQPTKEQPAQETAQALEEVEEQTAVTQEVPPALPDSQTVRFTTAELAALPDTALLDVLHLDSTFLLDVKYATADNFTGQVLYPCERCLLRKEVAFALLAAHEAFKEKGYRLKLFDCYRPNSVQWKMWEVYPDDRYVAHPAKGSVHNRGGAVDVTLVRHGAEVDMGTAFDFFGERAHFAYTQLPDSVLAHRQLLREVLEANGFGGITSEWWHFSYRNRHYAILDEPLCSISVP